jgi:very-short-patch-repair endonuclease
MQTPDHVLARHGGVARGTLLHQFGLDRRVLERAARDGSILRIRQGVYAARQAEADVVTAALHGGALTCSRALRLHGIWSLESDAAPHVWVGTHGRVHHRDCECVSHFAAGRTALGLAPLEDVLIHVHACRGDEAFFAALESAIRQRKISASARARIRRRLPTYARWLVDFARQDADSGLESIVRLRLHRIGILVACQRSIVSVGRVDFVVAGLLLLEVDGVENHDSASHRHKDLRRDAAASVQGFETLRFDYALVIHDWPVVESAILAALGRAHDRIEAR